MKPRRHSQRCRESLDSSSYEVLTHDKRRPKANQTKCSATDVETGQKTLNRTLSLSHSPFLSPYSGFFQYLSLIAPPVGIVSGQLWVPMREMKWNGLRNVDKTNQCLSHFITHFLRLLQLNAGLLKHSYFAAFGGIFNLFSQKKITKISQRKIWYI